MSEYPSGRPSHFALHYLKWLMDSGAVQEVGPDAFALLTVVVMREDDTRYQRAVNFFNEQLADRCGIVSTHALIRARTRAVEAGLLNYEPATKRNPGRYFVCGFNAQSARKTEGISPDSMRKTQGKRKESGRNPSTSIPNPILPLNTFDSWFAMYPRKEAKGDAQKAYPKAITEITKTNKVDAEHAAQLLAQWTQERIPGLLATERKFRPYPASWLNAQRYRDELNTAVSQESVPPVQVGNYVRKPKVRA